MPIHFLFLPATFLINIRTTLTTENDLHTRSGFPIPRTNLPERRSLTAVIPRVLSTFDAMAEVAADDFLDAL